MLEPMVVGPLFLLPVLVALLTGLFGCFLALAMIRPPGQGIIGGTSQVQRIIFAGRGGGGIGLRGLV
jgi:hypothetical protein